MALGRADDPYRACMTDLLNQFTTYDQAVDVVSCWQSLLKYGYAADLTYFDRFPELGSDNLTPDFTALFREEYGLIGETKRTFPRDPQQFKKELDQLVKYDAPLPLRADGKGRRVTPKIQDILLVISADDSNEITQRISELLAKGEYHFDGNLILMEYFYNAGNRTARYSFRKTMGQNRPFRDVCLPHDARLEVLLGEQRKSFHVTVPQFMPDKLREVFCNDQPPSIYTAVYLWNKVFYDQLDADQRDVWRLGNPQRVLPIKTSLESITTALNRDYLPKGNARRVWIQQCLAFLCDAGLAEDLGNQNYEVRFSNQTMAIGARKQGEPEEELQDVIRELAGLIAKRYCGRVAGSESGTQHPPAEKQKKVQPMTLEEFIARPSPGQENH